MAFQYDMKKAKQRMAAAWQGELLDRVCIAVPVRQKGYVPPVEPTTAQGWKQFWTDPYGIYKRYYSVFKNTYYGGDALPILDVSQAPSGCAGFFQGARYQYGKNVWFFPSLTGDVREMSLEFDPRSEMLTSMLRSVKIACELCQGEYLVSMPDIAGALDALAHLRGTEDLLADMGAEEDEYVDRCVDSIMEVWRAATRSFFEMTIPVNGGGCSIYWLGTWAPGTHTQLQCDLSVMLSRDMFIKHGIHELRELSQGIDYPLYHLDGCEQTRILDLLLDIETIRIVQWTAVVGQPSPAEKIPYLQQIQKAGKALVLKVSKRDLVPLMENLSSKGLYLYITDAQDAEEAERIVATAAKLTHD